MQLRMASGAAHLLVWHRRTRSFILQRCAQCILAGFVLVCLACNSHQVSAPRPDPSLKSAEHGQSQSPSSQPITTQPSEDITYAKNPDKFVQEPVYERPFSISNPTTAEQHFDVGVNYDNKKQFADAIAEYEKALQLRSNWAVAHARAAKDYAQLGQIDNAIKHWTAAIQYDPQFFSVYDQLASAYAKQGQVRKAIDTYSALVKYPAMEMATRYQLALWYEQIGDRVEAKENFQRYRQLALQSGPEEQKSERFQIAERELQKLRQQTS